MSTPSPDIPFLVAITGGSGSGKSTLADALLEAVGEGRAVLLREDAYYWPLSHYGNPPTPQARVKLTAEIDYDSPSAKDESHLARDLRSLKAGQPVEQPVYDYSLHDRASEVRAIVPAPLIILEGLHALSMPAIAGLIDLSVYVDTPDDLRLARRVRRDFNERGRTVDSVLDQYLGTVRAAHYAHTYPAKFSADLVLADDGLPAYGHLRPSAEAISRMLAPVLDRLRLRGVIPAA